MGYFSELETMNVNARQKTTETSRVSRLEEWLCYLEDKLENLEAKRKLSRNSLYEDYYYGDSRPLYEYDDPDAVPDLKIAIKQTKEKIEAEYDKNMRMLEWRLSVLLKGETPEGQLAFTDMFSFSADAA